MAVRLVMNAVYFGGEILPSYIPGVLYEGRFEIRP